MTAFKDLPFEARLAKMGDEAEAKFEEVYPRGWARWGVNRPRLKVSALPSFVRGAPDYVTAEGFFDAMGCHKDQLLKVKVEKYVVLSMWDQFWPTSVFVWDSFNQRYTYVPLRQLTDSLITAHQDVFPEGKVRWDFPLNDLEAEWVHT